MSAQLVKATAPGQDSIQHAEQFFSDYVGHHDVDIRRMLQVVMWSHSTRTGNSLLTPMNAALVKAGITGMYAV